MSKILSQWEIDALLNSVGGDETTALPQVGVPANDRSVKLYDFRRPDKFSKDHLRAIQNVHETFARSVTSSLTSYLRSSTTLHLTSIEQVVYDEYTQQLANPTVVNLVELQPLVGRIVVELNMNLALAMLDRMMGGTGQVGNRRTELTDIELALVRSLSSTIIASLRESWSMVADVQPILVDTVLSAEFVQAALPGDIAVLLLLEVQTLGVSGTMSLCIPHQVVEPLMDRLSTQLWFSSPRKSGSDDGRVRLDEALRRVVLPVTAVLGTTSITVAELVDLREGDVIRLDRSIDSDLTMLVGGRARFVGRPGILAGNRALEVSGVVAGVLDEEVAA